MECATCGQEVKIRINARRSPHSRQAQKGHYRAMKDHDLCRRCFRGLMDSAAAAHRAATQRPADPASHPDTSPPTNPP